MKTTNIIRPLVAAVLISLIPVVAMQFTEEVRWDLRDFIIMGILLFGTGIGLELVNTRNKDFKQRAAISFAVLAAFFLIWAELAVGVFGSPFAGS